eukprot:TRINITY_DN1513_c0_g1_i1.p1 TRINITY_DN1513_c0_g1~~TRINITY_DN1513_c0_g1_i1.p1  ORF type:complete len:1096 (-),score=156.62 TRINITY_DN1513_c0_g1_i1:35-3298(-)
MLRACSIGISCVVKAAMVFVPVLLLFHLFVGNNFTLGDLWSTRGAKFIPAVLGAGALALFVAAAIDRAGSHLSVVSPKLEWVSEADVLLSERELLKTERKKETMMNRDETGESNDDESWGLALSGGGLRGAAITAGVLWELERTGQLKKFDYISTVSGSGFAVAAYMSHLHAQNTKNAQDSRNSQNGQDSQNGRNAQNGQNALNSQDGQTAQDGQNSQDAQGQTTQDAQGQTTQDAQGQTTQDAQVSQDSQDGQNSHDSPAAAAGSPSAAARGPRGPAEAAAALLRKKSDFLALSQSLYKSPFEFFRPVFPLLAHLVIVWQYAVVLAIALDLLLGKKLRCISQLSKGCIAADQPCYYRNVTHPYNVSSGTVSATWMIDAVGIILSTNFTINSTTKATVWPTLAPAPLVDGELQLNLFYLCQWLLLALVVVLVVVISFGVLSGFARCCSPVGRCWLDKRDRVARLSHCLCTCCCCEDETKAELPVHDTSPGLLATAMTITIASCLYIDLVVALAYYFDRISFAANSQSVLFGGISVATVLTFISSLLGMITRSSNVQRTLIYASGLIGPVIILLISARIAQSFIIDVCTTVRNRSLFLGINAFVVIAKHFFSMHYHTLSSTLFDWYRVRVKRAFIFEDNDCAFVDLPPRPVVIVNAALNDYSPPKANSGYTGPRAAFKFLNCQPFVFTQLHCGSRVTQYLQTKKSDLKGTAVLQSLQQLKCSQVFTIGAAVFGLGSGTVPVPLPLRLSVALFSIGVTKWFEFDSLVSFRCFSISREWVKLLLAAVVACLDLLLAAVCIWIFKRNTSDTDTDIGDEPLPTLIAVAIVLIFGSVLPLFVALFPPFYPMFLCHPTAQRFLALCGARWNHENPNKPPYIHLSDGGHVDNLGVLQLLLRRCKNIVVVDATEDPDLSYDHLRNALQRAADETIKIETCIPEGRDQAHFCFRVVYPASEGRSVEGCIHYIKSTVIPKWYPSLLRLEAGTAISDKHFPNHGFATLFTPAVTTKYIHLGAVAAAALLLNGTGSPASPKSTSSNRSSSTSSSNTTVPVCPREEAAKSCYEAVVETFPYINEGSSLSSVGSVGFSLNQV